MPTNNTRAPISRDDLGMIPRGFEPVEAGEHAAGMNGEEAGTRIKFPGKTAEHLDKALVRFVRVRIVPEKNPYCYSLAARSHPLQTPGDHIEEMPGGIGFEGGDINESAS
jgi:hypothetical protein